MYFIRLFISNQLGQSEDLTLKKKVLRFCRKHIAFLMANSCIFKNIIQKRVVKYWAINLELKFLYESIHHSTEGLENFLSKLSLKELLNTELTFSRLVEIQKERIRKSALTEKVNVKMMDYRDVSKKYDIIVSIEMIEAVGEKYLNKYFQIIKKNLATGGRAAIQAIIIKEELEILITYI